MKGKLLLAVLLCSLMPCTAAASKPSSKAVKKPAASARAQFDKASQAFEAYDFEEAATDINRYLSTRSKADEEQDNAGSRDQAMLLKERIELGRAQLDRVEQVEIIDTVWVPKQEFYKFYKLSKSAGSFAKPSSIATLSQGKALKTSPVYVTENEDQILWSDGALKQSSLLADGSWEAPQTILDYNTTFGQASGHELSFPFMLSDGMTLYFAADGESSLGGLDIFVSRSDDDGSFLQPANLGMPYNSPANDYLYAIDEEAGLGYWASDRDTPNDFVAIYTFIPHEMRSNYSPDLEGLVEFAQIRDFKATQDSGKDYAAIIAKRDQLVNQTSDNNPSQYFDFSLPGKRVYHQLSDFHSSEAKRAMKELLSLKKTLSQKKQYLEKLRQQYSSGMQNVAPRILELEKELPNLQNQVQTLSNRIVLLES